MYVWRSRLYCLFSLWRFPAPRFRRYLDVLLMVANILPIERNIGILRLELSQHVGVQRSAPDAHAARGSEDIQDARPLAMPLAIEVHQIGGLVSTLISDNAQERHSALLALLRPGW